MAAPLRLLLAAVLLASACGAARAPSVDREAMREASRPEIPDQFASAKAYAHYLRARLAWTTGDSAKAAEELKLALVYDDASAELHVALSEALAKSGQLEQAEWESSRALELDPKGSAAADAHLLLGKIAGAEGKRTTAITELRAAIATQVARNSADADEAIDPEAWHVLGELYLQTGDETAAAHTFEDLSTRLPGEGSGFLEMGRFFFEKKDLARARTYFAKAVDRQPSDAESQLRLAQTDEALERWDDARKDYEAVLRLDNENGEALLAVARLSIRAGDLPGARAYVRELIRVSNDEPNARVSAALAWLDAHKSAEALALVEEGIRSHPDPRLQFVKGLVQQDQKRWSEAAASFGQLKPADGELYVSARANLAYCLSQAGKHAEAERSLAAPMKARPGEARLVVMLAHVKERAGRSNEAIDLLRRSIAEREKAGMAPDGTLDLYEALASSLEKAGRAKEAVASLQKALESRPREENLLYALGAAYEKAGDTEAAVAQMKALLTLDPDHADALNFVGYTYAEKGVKLEEAEKLVGRAVQLKPENGYFLDSLGWVFYKKGDFARAVTLLEKADLLSGPEPTILEHLGDAYRSAQRPTDAVAAYRRALKAVDPDTPSGEVQHRVALEQKLKELSSLDVRPAKR